MAEKEKKSLKQKLIGKGYEKDVSSDAHSVVGAIYKYGSEATEEQIINDLLLKERVSHNSLEGYFLPSKVRTGLRILEEESYVLFDKGKYVLTSLAKNFLDN